MLKMEEGYVWNKQMKWLKCSGRAKDANANLVGYFVVEIRYAWANAKLAKHSHLSFLEAFFLSQTLCPLEINCTYSSE